MQEAQATRSHVLQTALISMGQKESQLNDFHEQLAGSAAVMEATQAYLQQFQDQAEELEHEL